MTSSKITTIRDVLEQDALIESIIESGKIGTIVRKGRTIFYANAEPMHLGLMVEGTSKFEVARKLLDIANR